MITYHKKSSRGTVGVGERGLEISKFETSPPPRYGDATFRRLGSKREPRVRLKTIKRREIKVSQLSMVLLCRDRSLNIRKLAAKIQAHFKQYRKMPRRVCHLVPFLKSSPSSLYEPKEKALAWMGSVE